MVPSGTGPVSSTRFRQRLRATDPGIKDGELIRRFALPNKEGWCQGKSIRGSDMSEVHLGKLRLLEADYGGQPPAVQQSDLREINHLRSQLGMPLVDARLNEIGTALE